MILLEGDFLKVFKSAGHQFSRGGLGGKNFGSAQKRIN